ncbi:conserved exported protein of unknown function [Pseudodesulfovibrio profundus]|uniref:Porin domain-containing protein n=1 Tax=Pseudodesulfovibrio profundus TaxID=57320 RepID=A0A2C8F5V6_9BACT|nr:outer membrane homotrimeric porin [Pseudodesulfovibrio profundus]SOB58100.1 conserved exported protein of unknown function [Pseudodesulfovibrio profundus]
MKRLIMLAVLCAFVLGASAASAADLKVSGAFVTDAAWMGGWDFDDEADSSAFDLKTRMDLVFQVVASEDLKAVFYTRTDALWGQDEFAAGATDAAIGVRRVYLDFNYAGVNFKTGFLPVTLPNEVGGSLILDEEVTAVVASGAFTENVDYMGAYIRVDSEAGDTNLTSNAQFDVYAAALPVTFDGFGMTPFVAYGNIGDNNSITDPDGDDETAGLEDASAYWLGTTYAVNAFDPIVVKGDINYGNLDADGEANDASGWAFTLDVAYTGMDMMTPEAYFVYTSGEDDDTTDGSERLPQIDPDWAIGTFFFGGDYFLQGSIDEEVLGFWALGAQLNDIASFAEGLTHQAIVIYAQGTNDEDWAKTQDFDGRTLSEEDSLIELDFNTYYKLMDELTVGLELGYLNLDADKDVWGEDGGSAYKVSTGIAYAF